MHLSITPPPQLSHVIVVAVSHSLLLVHVLYFIYIAELGQETVTEIEKKAVPAVFF